MPGVLDDGLVSGYARSFNALDDECYTNSIPNADAEAFLLKNVPRFTCPDKDIERTYYFRWWTFRKHLKHVKDFWVITEFLPKVPWSGAYNTIVCPAGHHLMEGRWLRDPTFVTDDARFWLADKCAGHRWLYSSWLFTGTCRLAEITGQDDLPVSLLDDAVRCFERWEEGFDRGGGNRMGGDGCGGFLSVDGHEGTEMSLGGHGYKPLFMSAQWSEAKSIAAVARRAGREGLADRFEEKAEAVRKSLFDRCWNPDVRFFTTCTAAGKKGSVRELHGYAPWYFGVPVDGREPDWNQLVDRQGFAGVCGLSFPERRAKGFVIDFRGHACKWNGPSWPFATSVALTAFANDLHACHAKGRFAHESLFPALLHQYAAQHVRLRDPLVDGDARIVPWIDENLHPDRQQWIARDMLSADAKAGKKGTRERGKDYNHSTFCDLVISGLVGFVSQGRKGFAVDPLCPLEWSSFVMENLRYRDHDVTIRWQKGHGLVVAVDHREVARRQTLGWLDVPLDAGVGSGR